MASHLSQGHYDGAQFIAIIISTWHNNKTLQGNKSSNFKETFCKFVTHLVSYGIAQSHWRYTDRFHCILTLRHSSYRKVSLQQFNQLLPVFFIVVNSVITLLMTIYFNPCHITWNIKWHCEQNGNRHTYSISFEKDTKITPITT